MRKVPLSVAALLFIGVAVHTEAATFGWLSFLPKAERAKAAQLVADSDAALSALKADRARTLGTKRSYADAARVLASALDGYAGNPDAFSFVLIQAGQGSSSAENAAGVLADKRRLRWELSRDIASSRYGHVSPGGFVTAESAENSAVRLGHALREILSKRIAKLPKKTLSPAVKALEDRVASHPDCPGQPFAELRAAAAQLGEAQYRAWLLALTSLVPGSLAADETVALGKTEAELAFMSVKAAFIDAYAVRMIMREAIPASAAAAWYVDGLAPSTRPVQYVQASPQSLASLASFLRNLAAADPASIALCLHEDEAVASAFAECGALAWAAYRSSPAAFSADLGLEQGIVRQALQAAWRATFRNPVSQVVEIDRQAVFRAEAFAVGVEEAEVALRVGRSSSSETAARLLADFAELRRDGPAFEALRLGGRYEAVRAGVRTAFLETVSALSPSIEAEARKSLASASSIASPAAAKPDAEGAPNEGSAFRLLVAPDDPFSVVAVAATFERTVGGISIKTAVSPATLVKALGPLSALIESGALIVTLPCFVEGRLPAADELAFLGADKAVIGEGSEFVREFLTRLAGRYGVPSDFVSMPSSAPFAMERRFADFSAVAARFMTKDGGIER